MDTLIRNADVVLETGIVRVDVGVSGGRIVALLADSSDVSAVETIDAAGRFCHRDAGSGSRRRDHHL